MHGNEYENALRDDDSNDDLPPLKRVRNARFATINHGFVTVTQTLVTPDAEQAPAVNKPAQTTLPPSKDA